MKKSKNKNLKQRDRKTPFVFVNFAMTADGKIAFANHKFIPFASRRDRDHMMELRATADAVMSGARTVESNGATLGPGGAKYRGLRLKRGLGEYNLRIIASGSGSVDTDAEIFKHRFSPVIVLTTARISKNKLRQLRPLVHQIKIFGGREINFQAAFRWLRKKWNVKRLLCEGGGELHSALIRADLVDELHLTICPKIFGGRDTPTVADGCVALNLADAARFRLKSVRRIGDELFTVFSALKVAL
ncbi:MAG: RibD family protein [Verrucomicrobiota bacterium]|jgi:riboflavin-specific deaminase-like protein